jgi:hypothetical protein
MATDSRSLPDLPNKKNATNWVEKAGGLPSYIERIAKHLHSEKGMTVSRAIATAVNTVKKWCAGKGDVKADTKTKACAAVESWEAKKKSSGINASVNGNGKERMVALDGVLVTESDRDLCLSIAREIEPPVEDDEFDMAAYQLALSQARAERGLEDPAEESLDLAAEDEALDDFNEGEFQLHLAMARRERGLPVRPLNLAIVFDPDEHPRDLKGRFKEVVGGLDVGGSVDLPDGTRVTNTGSAFKVVSPDHGKATTIKSGDTAAEKALAYSGASTNPKSIGGARSYPSNARAVQAHEKKAADGGSKGKDIFPDDHVTLPDGSVKKVTEVGTGMVAGVRGPYVIVEGGRMLLQENVKHATEGEAQSGRKDPLGQAAAGATRESADAHAAAAKKAGAPKSKLAQAEAKKKDQGRQDLIDELKTTTAPAERKQLLDSYGAEVKGGKLHYNGEVIPLEEGKPGPGSFDHLSDESDSPLSDSPAKAATKTYEHHLSWLKKLEDGRQYHGVIGATESVVRQGDKYHLVDSKGLLDAVHKDGLDVDAAIKKASIQEVDSPEAAAHAMAEREHGPKDAGSAIQQAFEAMDSDERAAVDAALESSSHPDYLDQSGVSEAEFAKLRKAVKDGTLDDLPGADDTLIEMLKDAHQYDGLGDDGDYEALDRAINRLTAGS